MFDSGKVGIAAGGQVLSYEEAEVHNATLGESVNVGGSLSITDADRDAAIPAAATTVTFLSPSKRMMKPNLNSV